MRLGYKVVHPEDIQQFNNNEANSKVHKICNSIISQLQDEHQKEILSKGYILDVYSEDRLSRNFIMKVPKASDGLKNDLLSQYPFIICIKD
jgi:hypothetical protein